MSRPSTMASDKSVLLDEDHISDYFGGNHDMAALYLRVLESDTVSAAGLEVRDCKNTTLACLVVCVLCPMSWRLQALSGFSFFRIHNRPLLKLTFAATLRLPAASVHSVRNPLCFLATALCIVHRVLTSRILLQPKKPECAAAKQKKSGKKRRGNWQRLLHKRARRVGLSMQQRSRSGKKKWESLQKKRASLPTRMRPAQSHLSRQ